MNSRGKKWRQLVAPLVNIYPVQRRRRLKETQCGWQLKGTLARSNFSQKERGGTHLIPTGSTKGDIGAAKELLTGGLEF